MDWKLQMGGPDITMNRKPRDKHPDVDTETNTGNNSDTDTDVDIETKY